MDRIGYAGSALALVLVCGAACSHDSRTTSANETSDTDGRGHVDAYGNRTYDPNGVDRSRTNAGDGDRSGYTGARSSPDSSTVESADWNGRNIRDASVRSARDYQSSRSDFNRASWGDRTWSDSQVVLINEADIPNSARSSLSREAGGATLTETGSGMWDGKQAYCAKVMKYGHPYKVISDADGNLLATRRLD